MNHLKLSFEPQAPREERLVVYEAIIEFNRSVTNDRDYSPIVIFLRDDSDTIKGGLLGETWGGWFHLQFLWIAESFRSKGYGSQLLQVAEAEARAKGCRNAFLQTFSFQARPFYERFGYEVFGMLDYPKGHTFYFMKKALIGEDTKA